MLSFQNMAKAAAERQKEYRERKKQSDSDYLKSEQERTKFKRKTMKSLSKIFSILSSQNPSAYQLTR